MEIDFLTIKGSQFTISMKDVDEPYSRNLAQLKNYNKADYLKGVITDAADLAEAHSTHLFSTEAEALDTLRNAFSKVLADDRVAGRGHKCDVMEFENPATVNQEMVFIC